MNEVLLNDRILTVPQVAKYLQISKAKAYHMVQRKSIPAIRFGRNVRIRESDLKKWLDLQLQTASQTYN